MFCRVFNQHMQYASLSGMSHSTGYPVNPSSRLDNIDPSISDPAPTLASVLWSLSTSMNSLLMPLLNMSNSLGDGTLVSSCVTSQDRIRRLDTVIDSIDGSFFCHKLANIVHAAMLLYCVRRRHCKLLGDVDTQDKQKSTTSGHCCRVLLRLPLTPPVHWDMYLSTFCLH
jgi:hypothetical protein